MTPTLSDSEKLFNSLMQIRKLTTVQFQNLDKDHPATMLQFAALQFIDDQPQDTVSHLAKYLFLSKSSTTQLTERMTKSGYIKKEADTTDQRVTRLSLTENGTKQLAILRKQTIEIFDSIFSKLPQKDIKELIRIHDLLIVSLRHDSVN